MLEGGSFSPGAAPRTARPARAVANRGARVRFDARKGVPMGPLTCLTGGCAERRAVQDLLIWLLVSWMGAPSRRARWSGYEALEQVPIAARSQLVLVPLGAGKPLRVGDDDARAFTRVR